MKAHFTEAEKQEAQMRLLGCIETVRSEEFMAFLNSCCPVEAEGPCIEAADAAMTTLRQFPPQVGIHAMAYLLALTVNVKEGTLDQALALVTAAWFQAERRLLAEVGRERLPLKVGSWAEPTDDEDSRDRLYPSDENS